MTRFWQHLRSGDWLTPQRIVAYSVAMLAVSSLAIAVWIGLSSNSIDRNDKPIGTDFSNVYAAGTLVWQGRAADAYDPALQHAAEMVVFDGREVPFYGWHYPPFFFAVATLVAALPYGFGLALWVVAGVAAYLATIRNIVPQPATWLVALGCPAVLVNIGHGQNGFLTASLLGSGLLLLDRRPWLSGIMIGLLAYKPQFGVLIPIALVAGGHWRCIAGAALTVAALVAVSFATLGERVWIAFIGSMKFTQAIVLEQGGTGWEKIQSIFSAARMWGASPPLAYVLQLALVLALAASLAALWRSKAAFDLKAAALATGSLLATPYVLDYDLMVLPVAVAFFARHGMTHGFRSCEISLLAAAWIVPLLTRSVASISGIPLGLVLLLLLYAVILRRGCSDRAGLIAPAPRLAQA